MMMDTLIAAGDRLAEALLAENEALARLDMPGAAGLSGAKMRATDAFAAAFAAMPLVALGLLLLGAGRRWFAVRPAGAG
jgi:hypothetical protein